jgi:hypothetical protein
VKKRGREQELMAAAIKDLRGLGYSVSELTDGFDRTRHAFSLVRGDVAERIFIQTRANEEATYRYTIGLIHQYLSKVDSFVVWLENEPFLYKIPASWLSLRYESACEMAEAGFSGTRDEQWRVNIWCDTHEFRGQNSTEREPIGQFKIERPRSSKAHPSAKND